MKFVIDLSVGKCDYNNYCTCRNTGEVASVQYAKRMIAKDKLNFLGHLVGKEGVSCDPTKIKAMREMQAPTSLTELRRFMGMANQLGKFSPNLAEYSQPLRELMSNKRAWVWGAAQQNAFFIGRRQLRRR